jgi:3-methyladenine DNA glycosylase AlkC
LGLHLFSKRENNEKCTNMILEALKAKKEKHVCKYLCAQAQQFVCAK